MDPSTTERPLAGRDLSKAQWGKAPVDNGPQVPVLERYKPRDPEAFARSLKNFGADEQIVGKYLQSADLAEMVEEAVGALEVSQQVGPSERYMTSQQVDNIYRLFGWSGMNAMIPPELQKGREEVEQLHGDFLNKSDIQIQKGPQEISEEEII